MTRTEAVKIVGEDIIDELEHLNCEPTETLDYDDLDWWKASLQLDNGDWLHAYYCTDEDDSQAVEDNGGDWGAIDWEIESYEIEEMYGHA